VNLSVGYDGAHTRKETLDFAHLSALAEALPKVEWESLPIDRDPKAADPAPSYQNWKGSRGFGGMSGLFDDDEERQWGKNGAKAKKGKTPLMPVGTFPTNDPRDDVGFSGMSMQEIEDAVQDDVTWTVEHIVKLMRANSKMTADIDVLNRLLGL
jgi:hypothetical protein